MGCRSRASATELLRVVAEFDADATGYRLVPDPPRRLPGRGAHLHPDAACLTQALRRRAFGRALRLSVAVDSTALERYVTSRRDPAAREIDGAHNGERPRKQGR
nr:YlxR family protein [Stackebrandtia albiflava]